MIHKISLRFLMMQYEDKTDEFIRRVSKNTGIPRMKVRWVYSRYMQKITYGLANGSEINNRDFKLHLHYKTLRDTGLTERTIRRAIRPNISKYFLFYVVNFQAKRNYYNYRPTRWMKKKIRQYIEADENLEIVPQ